MWERLLWLGFKGVEYGGAGGLGGLLWISQQTKVTFVPHALKKERVAFFLAEASMSLLKGKGSHDSIHVSGSQWETKSWEDFRRQATVGHTLAVGKPFALGVRFTPNLKTMFKPQA